MKLSFLLLAIFISGIQVRAQATQFPGQDRLIARYACTANVWPSGPLDGPKYLAVISSDAASRVMEVQLSVGSEYAPQKQIFGIFKVSKSVLPNGHIGLNDIATNGAHFRMDLRGIPLVGSDVSAKVTAHSPNGDLDIVMSCRVLMRAY